MTTLAQLRNAALAQPEVERTVGNGRHEFRVGERQFAAAEGGIADLWLSAPDVRRFVDDEGTGEPIRSRGRVTGVRFDLADVNGQALNHWVRRAWAHRAPRRLAAAANDAGQAEPGSVGDLPAAIGRPATRGLAGAGLTSLADVAARSDDELLAIHGVGPKAVQILRAAIGSET